MFDQAHRIQRQSIELVVAGGIENARKYELRLENLCREALPALLDAVLSEIDVPERVLYIDRLELDLGALLSAGFEEEFSLRTASILREQLLARSAPLLDSSAVAALAVPHAADGKRAPGGAGGDAVTPVAQHAFAVMHYFLRHGVLPWNSVAASLPALENVFLAALKSQPRDCRRMLLPLLRQQPARTRLVLQFSEELLQEVAGLFIPDAAFRPRTMIREMGSLLVPLPAGFASEADLGHGLWDALLAALAQEYQQPTGREIMQNLLLFLAGTLGIDKRLLAKRLHDGVTERLRLAQSCPAIVQDGVAAFYLRHHRETSAPGIGPEEEGSAAAASQRDHSLTQDNRQEMGQAEKPAVEDIPAIGDNAVPPAAAVPLPQDSERTAANRESGPSQPAVPGKERQFVSPPGQRHGAGVKASVAGASRPGAASGREVGTLSAAGQEQPRHPAAADDSGHQAGEADNRSGRSGAGVKDAGRATRPPVRSGADRPPAPAGETAATPSATKHPRQADRLPAGAAGPPPATDSDHDPATPAVKVTPAAGEATYFQPTPGGSADRLTSEAGRDEPAAVSSSDPVPSPAPDFAELANGGLVLLWPYFGMLFSRAGLVRDNGFVHRTARKRAVHVLQFLVTGQEETEEQQLILNKLLCGVEPGEPVPRKVRLTDREREGCADLLKSAISHWPAIKKTSCDGLRQAFLQRQAILRRDEGAWQLTVHRKAHDVLLERLPWGISIIKLSWMPAPLFVEW